MVRRTPCRLNSAATRAADGACTPRAEASWSREVIAAAVSSAKSGARRGETEASSFKAIVLRGARLQSKTSATPTPASTSSSTVQARGRDLWMHTRSSATNCISDSKADCLGDTRWANRAVSSNKTDDAVPISIHQSRSNRQGTAMVARRRFAHVLCVSAGTMSARYLRRPRSKDGSSGARSSEDNS